MHFGNLQFARMRAQLSSAWSSPHLTIDEVWIHRGAVL